MVFNRYLISECRNFIRTIWKLIGRIFHIFTISAAKFRFHFSKYQEMIRKSIKGRKHKIAERDKKSPALGGAFLLMPKKT